MRTIWGTVYTVVAATTLTGALLVADSVATRSTPLAIAGLVVFLMGIASLRVSIDARWLKDARQHLDAARERLADERAQLAAERAVFAADTERTIRDLEAQERRNAERLAEDRATMLAEIEIERERMHAALANAKAEIERKAVAVGFSMGRNGIGADDEPTRATVIALPIPEQPANTMGTGAYRT